MSADPLRVWPDRDPRLGDGLRARHAPQRFAFGIDGVAYIEDTTGELRRFPAGRPDHPAPPAREVIDEAVPRPAGRILAARSGTGVEAAGPDSR